MDYQSFTRIDIAYEKVFGCSPDISREDDMLTICALHYILAGKNLHLCVNDYVKPHYNFIINKKGFLFSRELANDILFEDMAEAHYSFNSEEMELLDMLADAVDKASVSALGQTKQYVAKSLARYMYAKDVQHLKTELDIQQEFTKTGNTLLNFVSAKKSNNRFNSLLKQYKEEQSLREQQEEPVAL